MTGRSSFGVWLAARMAERTMTQRQLGAYTGVDHSSISRIIRGERSVRYETVVALTDALGFEVVLRRRDDDVESRMVAASIPARESLAPGRGPRPRSRRRVAVEAPTPLVRRVG